MKTGIELIAEKRWNQVYKKGYDLDHDSGHTDGAIVKHAAVLCVYGTDARIIEQDEDYDEWAFHAKHKDESRIEQLSIAGALIAAEIDRLQNINKEL